MSQLDDLIDRFTEFNRFYTIMQGFFDPKFLGTDYSVVEIRILYEVFSNPGCTAKDLTQMLRLDKGYISHRVKNFEKAGFLERISGESDKRFQTLYLTDQGKELVSQLTLDNNNRLAAMLGDLSPEECTKLSEAMDTMTQILNKERNI